jgi:hypothetical protein
MDPTSREFIEALRVSEVGAQIASQLDAARLADRRQLADELARINSEIEKAYPRAVSAYEKQAAEVRKLEEALQAARTKAMQLAGARTTLSARYTSSRLDLEAQLAATASPLLRDFIARMREEAERTRKALTTTVRTEVNFVTGRKNDVVESNSARIRARLAAISAAVEAAQGAMLLADQSGIPDLLFRLEAGVPLLEAI